jgi:hypothetical protein
MTLSQPRVNKRSTSAILPNYLVFSAHSIRCAPFFASIFQNGLTAIPACGTIPL